MLLIREARLPGHGAQVPRYLGILVGAEQGTNQGCRPGYQSTTFGTRMGFLSRQRSGADSPPSQNVSLQTEARKSWASVPTQNLVYFYYLAFSWDRVPSGNPDG